MSATRAFAWWKGASSPRLPSLPSPEEEAVKAFFRQHSATGALDCNKAHLLLESLGYPVELPDALALLRRFRLGKDGTVILRHFVDCWAGIKAELEARYDDILPSLILEQINECRLRPSAYCGRLEKWAARCRPPSAAKVSDASWASALAEALEALGQVPRDSRTCSSSLHAFDSDPALARCAALHAADLAANGTIGHIGSDGSKPGSRIDRFGEWKGSCVENIFCGAKTAEDIVNGMLLDVEQPGRPSRLNLLSSDFTAAGVALGPHPTAGSVCVIVMTVSFQPKAASLWPAVVKWSPRSSARQSASAGTTRAESAAGLLRANQELVRHGEATLIEAKGNLTREMQDALQEVHPAVVTKVHNSLQDSRKTVQLVQQRDGRGSIAIIGGRSKPRLIML